MKTLELSKKYELNLNDPRVYKRVAHVLDWCDIYLSSDWNKMVSFKIIDKEFGQRNSDLSKFLRYKLLHKLGSYTPNCKNFGKLQLLEYRINKEGYDELRTLIASITVETNKNSSKSRRNKLNTVIVQHSNSNPVSYIHQVQYDKYKSEFENDVFVYNHSDKTGRDYHGLQTMKREYKKEFWNNVGYSYDYDIEACAPTLLVQYAEQLGLPRIIISNIYDFIENKDAERLRLATLLEVDISTIKQIINALFNGAILAANTQCSIYELLGYDLGKMITLQQDKFVTGLRRHVKNAWNKIRRHLKINKGLQKKWIRGEKWGIYYNLEKRVMNVIYTKLDEMNIAYFNEHDGFRTKVELDLNEIEKEIEEKTEFKIKIKGGERGINNYNNNNNNALKH